MHTSTLGSPTTVKVSPLTLNVARSHHIESGSEELMQLLPGHASGSANETSHVSLLFTQGSALVESALERAFSGASENVDGVVLRQIGAARLSIHPLHTVTGGSAGALMLIYPTKENGAKGHDLLDTVDSVYEVNLQTGDLRILSGPKRARRIFTGPAMKTVQAWEETIHPEDRQRVLEARQALVDRGTPMDLKYRIRTRENDFEWIHDRCIRVGDTDGELFQIGITRPSEADVDGFGLPNMNSCAILDATEELFVYLEPDLSIRWLNRAAAKSVSMPMARLIGRHCYEVWHGRDTECENCPVVRASETMEPQGAEVTTPDGRRFYIRGYPVADSDGTLHGLVEFGRDITHQRNTEEALRKTAGLLESILENSPYPISVLDTEGHYIMVNQATATLYGRPREALIGEHLTNLLPDETGFLFDRRIRRLVREKRPVIVEDEIANGDDTRVFYTTLFPIWGDNGTIVAIGGMTTDITELKDAQDKLERADAQKTKLLEGIHSRVKKNLQIISGVMRLSDSPNLSPETRELLRQTQVRIRAMSLVHEHIFETDEFGAVDLAVYAQSLIGEIIRAYGCDDRVSLSLWSDSVVVPLDFAVSFGLILNELVSHVCKHAFVPQQGGLLELSIADGTQAVTLRVAGNGTSVAQAIEGNLSLVVAEALAESLGGTMTIDTEDGSAWEVTLPLATEDRS